MSAGRTFCNCDNPKQIAQRLGRRYHEQTYGDQERGFWRDINRGGQHSDMTTNNGITNLRPAGGRPPGVRNRLSNKLITDLSDIWHANGPDILRKMAMRDPIQLARLAYATLPKDILVSVEQRVPGGLDADDWALLMRVLDTIKGAIPPDREAPPAEIFGVIETALRSHFARAIEL